MASSDVSPQTVIEEIVVVSAREKSPYSPLDLPRCDTQSTVTSYRRVAAPLPKGARVILASQLFERFAFYACTMVFQNYLQWPAGVPNQAGALGLGQSVATAFTSSFLLIAYISPIIGGVISDQWLGPYKTIVTMYIFYVAGIFILTITSLPSINASAGLPGFVVAAFLIALGGGAIKAVIAPFAASQYSHRKPAFALHDGEKVIIDPSLNLQSIYVWFYFAVCTGCVLSYGIMPFIEIYFGFWLTFTFAFVSLIISIIPIVVGNKHLIHSAPSKKNILLKVWRVCRKQMAARKERSPKEKLTEEEAQDLAFFEDLKESFKVIKMFPPVIVYYICYLQIFNNFISQAAVMERPKGFSGDLMGFFSCVFTALGLPTLSIFIYPTLRRYKISFGQIRRITLGLFNSTIAMLLSAIIQYYIYRAADNGEKISIWWQIPTFFAGAISEIFVEFSYAEFAYAQAPPSIRSLVSALSNLPCAIASIILISFSSFFRDPYMHYVYGTIASLAFITAITFYLGYRKYEKPHNNEGKVALPDDRSEITLT